MKFPANTAAGEDRIFSFHINADADDKLEIRIVNVGAADFEGHIKIVRSRPESFAVNTGRTFQSNEN